jgi:hypothetical protein
MSVWGEESALEPAVDTTTTEPNPDEGQEDPGAPNRPDYSPASTRIEAHCSRVS